MSEVSVKFQEKQNLIIFNLSLFFFAFQTESLQLEEKSTLLMILTSRNSQQALWLCCAVGSVKN